ncbi:MAG TPA: ABC transporter ATP-binding protein [Syntrophales bacterium]|jgi:branched-chain amino acid transport system ATP-binding protein|nr:ABC transporter ATP-binding protein [Syntrophales bacterium]HON23496.1 ABC transporter ATP-binding protein [Syntrophales bacterium]HOU78765.1 ABC transporter ATP-binding protein [Syntrophales bacterium]HPC33385.1 ABC transporter ATP-binding protein [Syntrophales bacterium]HQG34951.1 ABC transporter ATP-binding protein [Syntrophales bacterium]
MLRVEKLVVRYGQMEALRGVTMEITPGEMVALIGANGAGKSTLLNTVSGLVPAAAGEITWEGKSLRGLSPDMVCRKGIVQVPEGRKLFPAMTVEENLLMGAYLPALRKKAPAALQRVYAIFPRLADRRRQLAGSLSGGEQQMAALGRALMASPRLLMLDEPSLGLSPKAAAEIFAIIRGLNREGLSILLVSQEVLETLAITTRGYVLENGAVVMSGPAAALREDPQVKTSYLGL